MCAPFFTLIIDTLMLPVCQTPCQGGWTDLGAKAQEQHSNRGGVTRERGALKKSVTVGILSQRGGRGSDPIPTF